MEGSDYHTLRRAWINERFSPELLIFEEQCIENLKELIEFQVLQAEKHY